MSGPRRRGPSVRPALRLAGLLVVLGGLFGMHGLSDHGTGAMSSHAAMSDTTLAVHPSEVQSAITSVGDRVRSGLAQVWVAGDDPSGAGMNMSMTAMCVAISAVCLLALVRRLLSSRRWPVPWLHPGWPRVSLRAGRAPDSPSLFVLSIQRC